MFVLFDPPMADLSQVNLQKQTIAQLTALCREHKLSGYSKLKKAALIEKLETYRDRSKALVSIAPPINIQPSDSDPVEKDSQRNSEVVLGDALDSAPSGATALVQTLPSKVAPQINHNEKPLKNASKPLNLTSSSKILPNVDSRFIASVATPLSSISSSSLPAAKFLKPKPNVTPTTLPEKRSIDHLPISITRAPKKRLLNPVTDDRTNKALFSTPEPHATPVRGAQTVLPPAQPVAPKTLPRDSIKATKRRFIPLKVKQTSSSEPATLTVASLTSCSAGILQPYLVEKDYDAPLSNISIPPSLSQRKRVKGLALILRDLSDADRQACCLASRTLRYAVYVSAQFVLCEEFPGKRTEFLLSRAQDCFTNLWPYLIFRRQEKARLKRLYEASFLSRFALNPISERLWGNPDTGNEVSSALRFTLSRLWFTVSLFGDSGRHFLKELVSSVTRLAGDEIWQITVQTEGGTVYTLLVLGLTGEPIGCQHQDQGSSRFVRSDWKRYMESASSVEAKRSLWENLRCANEEEFAKGISKLWMQKIEAEGDVGATKRRVAERYVMASVVANSVSGEQMTHLQMSMQTAGISLGGTNRARSNGAVSLFLSEHHHVESVHFVSSSGRAFHPAVASVQTPHREYFVLRENGLQIGCEEDGIALKPRVASSKGLPSTASSKNMLNPMRTLLAVGVIVLGVSLPVHGQASTGPSSTVTSGTSTGTPNPTTTSLQLLTTVGGASPSGNATGTGSTSQSGNGTRTQTTTLANVTSVNTGINPSTVIPSEFPRGEGFLNGPPAQSHLILAAGIAGLATLCL